MFFDDSLVGFIVMKSDFGLNETMADGYINEQKKLTAKQHWLLSSKHKKTYTHKAEKTTTDFDIWLVAFEAIEKKLLWWKYGTKNTLHTNKLCNTHHWLIPNWFVPSYYLVFYGYCCNCFVFYHLFIWRGNKEKQMWCKYQLNSELNALIDPTTHKKIMSKDNVSINSFGWIEEQEMLQIDYRLRNNGKWCKSTGWSWNEQRWSLYVNLICIGLQLLIT